MNLCKMRCLVKFSYAFLRIVLFTHVLHKEVNLRLKCKLNFFELQHHDHDHVVLGIFES